MNLQEPLRTRRRDLIGICFLFALPLLLVRYDIRPDTTQYTVVVLHAIAWEFKNCEKLV